MNWAHPVVVATVVGAPSLALGVLGYRRSLQVDKTAERVGILTGDRAAVDQVIAGLNQLIDNLQEDNKNVRDSLRDLAVRFQQVTDENVRLAAELVQLRTQLGGAS